MLNKIIIMGRLTRDPELRRTGSGTAVTSFSLAVDRDFKSKDSGERTTDFIDCVAWRNTAEYINRYGSKGRMAAVAGSLQIRQWTDKEGNKRTAWEVLVDSIYFADYQEKKKENIGSDPTNDPINQLVENVESMFGGPVGGGFSEMDEEDWNLPF